MASLKAGDRIYVCVKGNVICTDRVPDETKEFEIIAVDEYGVYLYIPCYYYLRNVFVVTYQFAKTMNVKDVYIKENSIYIQDNLVKSVSHLSQGICCIKCGEHFPYGASNQTNGTLICYLCRFNRFR